MQQLIDNYFNRLKKSIDKLNRSEIENFIKVLISAREQGRNIYFMGNGGSAASASHYVCDLNKGCKNKKDTPFKVMCLNDNTPILMAYANDASYEDVFVEQLQNFLSPNDVVVGISGSGNSKNVLKAIKYANSNNGITVGITGYDGGELRRIAMYSVNTNTNDMQISEDIHMTLCHLITQVVQEISMGDCCNAK